MKRVYLMPIVFILICILVGESNAQRFSFTYSAGLTKLLVIEDNEWIDGVTIKDNGWNKGIITSLNSFYRINSLFSAGLGISYSRMTYYKAYGPYEPYATPYIYSSFLGNIFPRTDINGSYRLFEFVPIIFRLNLTDHKTPGSGFILQLGAGIVRITDARKTETSTAANKFNTSNTTTENYPLFKVGLGYTFCNDKKISYILLPQFKLYITGYDYTGIFTFQLGVTYK